MTAPAVICALAALVLASCGGGDETSSSTTSSTGTATTVTTTTASAATSSTTSSSEGDGAPQRAEASRSAELPRTVGSVTSAVLTGSEGPEAICDQLVTATYVRTAYGDRQGCLAAQKPGTLAKSVQVGQVDEAGQRATAVAVPSGGPYNGVDVDVKLVADPDLEGAWQVDSLRANVPAGP